MSKGAVRQPVSFALYQLQRKNTVNKDVEAKDSLAYQRNYKCSFLAGAWRERGWEEGCQMKLGRYARAKQESSECRMRMDSFLRVH